MYSVIAFVLFMNFTFKQNYFGMGPYQDFSIYMFDFFDSYWVTLLVYVLGVALVLALGFQFNYILQLLKYKEEHKKDNKKSQEVIDNVENEIESRESNEVVE